MHDGIQQKYSFASPERRRRTGRLQRKFEDGTQVFELNEAVNGSKRSLVPRSLAASKCRIGDTASLFLHRQTKAGNWIAALWPEELNPWLNKRLPSLEEAVSGTVTGFNNTNTVAFIDFPWKGVILSGSLTKENLPEIEKQDINICLSIGDNLEAVIKRSEDIDLIFPLDCKSWYGNLIDRWRTQLALSASDSVHKDTITRYEISKRNSESITIEGRLLIIDDDPNFCNSIKNFFSTDHLTVDVSTISSPHGIQEATYAAVRKMPNFVIVDFDLDSNISISQEVRSTVVAYSLRNPAATVVVVSGNTDEAQKFARENDFQFLPKPVSHWQLIDHFSRESTDKKPERDVYLHQTHKLFAVEGTHKQIIQKARELLDKLCEQHSLDGAFWILRQSAGNYEVRATSNSLIDKIKREDAQHFKNSIIETLTMREKPSVSDIGDDPIVRRFVPNDATQLFALPLRIAGQSTRCIFFVANHPISDVVKNSIVDRSDHFDLLIQGILQAESIEEISTSAQLGRMAFASLHELRTEIQKISSAIEAGGNCDDVLSKVKSYLPDAIRLSAGELERFRPAEVKTEKIVPLIKRVVDRMKRYNRDARPRYMIRIDTTIDPHVADLNIPQPIALERILVNLIDNAADYLVDVPFRWITVEVSLKNLLNPTPIHISVRDTGPGIGIIQSESIFLPRRTGRPSESTGLGLFMSKELVKLLDGELLLMKRPRWTGAEFQIRLPLRY